MNIEHYLTIAVRNISRNPVFSLINIGGLTLGLTVCILVYVYVQRELNFDSWVENHENLYRVEMQYHNATWGNGYMNAIPVPLRQEIELKFPEISQSSLLDWTEETLQKANTVFYEKVVSVNSDFFEMIRLDFIYGNSRSAVPNPNSIVLSRSMSEKYFGKEDPIGEILTLGGNQAMVVSAVYEDFPKETHLPSGAFVQFDNAKFEAISNWNSSSPLLYVQIDDPRTIPSIHEKLRGVVAEHKPFMDKSETAPNEKFTFFLQRFQDIHLMSQGRTGENPYGNLILIYSYMGIALLILTISCVNYVNLSTARATTRAREVSLRKIMGAERKSLVLQFMGETTITAAIALFAAFFLSELLLPWLSDVVGGELAIAWSSDPNLWLVSLGMIGFCGIVAGTYPAIYVARMQPSAILHSTRPGLTSKSNFRNRLVVVQFTIAICLIAIAAVLYSQMNLANTINLGFDRDNLLVIRGLDHPLTRQNSKAFNNEVRNIRGVESVARAYNVPGDERYWSRTAFVQGSDPGNTPKIRIMPSDAEFFDTLRVPLISGRFLSINHLLDEVSANGGETVRANVIVNRSATRELGFDQPEEAVGTILVMPKLIKSAGEVTIVGVVEDFIFGSAKDSKDSIIFFRSELHVDQMLVRYRPEELDNVKGQIEGKWKHMFPETPIRLEFLDENLWETTSRESRQSKLIFGSSSIAISLACLGLLGLAIFTAESRKKEVSIRKVLGARIQDIIYLLSWQFSKPILLAIVIAIPIAWYFADQWLNNFSQRIDLGIHYFLFAGLISLLFAWITVGFHAWRVARNSPADSLHCE